MFSWVDVREYAKGRRITATETKVMIDTNNSVFLFTEWLNFGLWRVSFNTNCHKVLILKTTEEDDVVYETSKSKEFQSRLLLFSKLFHLIQYHKKLSLLSASSFSIIYSIKVRRIERSFPSRITPPRTTYVEFQTWTTILLYPLYRI